MKIGILTRDEDSWCTAKLIESLKKKGVQTHCLSFSDLSARLHMKPEASHGSLDILRDLKALIVRPIGRGSLEEIIFRLDLLHRLERLGMYIINPPHAIERSVDKYYALALLEEAKLPVPRTLVTENAIEALKGFNELGCDVVIKPIFGSRGIGSTRISDPDTAERIFNTLSFYHQVIYLQEFVPHGKSDLRIFVLGNRVLSAMRRVSAHWKTNISQGATPKPFSPSTEIKEMAVKASETIGCYIAGIDVVTTKGRPLIVELNSQPGWKGLQTVTKLDISDEIVDFVVSHIS